MGQGVIDRKKEMEYTQRQLEAAKCITRKAAPEEIENLLNGRGDEMGKRGPKPGFKRNKRINELELADQAQIQASKKAVADAARKYISDEIDDTPLIENVQKVKDFIGQFKIDQKVNTTAAGDEGEFIDVLKSEKPVIKLDQPRIGLGQETDFIKTLEDAVDATSYALHGVSYAEFKARPVPNTKESISRVFTGETGFTPAPKLVSQIRHEHVCQELTGLYLRKNHDYGDSFSETYRKLGIISAVTRITDKVNRLQSLCTKEQKVHDEGIRDTLIDLANYAIMTVMQLDGEA